VCSASEKDQSFLLGTTNHVLHWKLYAVLNPYHNGNQKVGKVVGGSRGERRVHRMHIARSSYIELCSSMFSSIQRLCCRFASYNDATNPMLLSRVHNLAIPISLSDRARTEPCIYSSKDSSFRPGGRERVGQCWESSYTLLLLPSSQRLRDDTNRGLAPMYRAVCNFYHGASRYTLMVDGTIVISDW